MNCRQWVLLAVALGITQTRTASAQQGWGYNFYGEIGSATNDKSSTANPTPITISGLSGVTSIAAGSYHTLALKGDGTVWAWGYNNYGALGNTTNVSTGNPNPTPAQVTGVSNVKAISGGYHSLALDTSGNVWAWGENLYGELGNTTNSGTAHANPTPTQISGMTNVTAIAAGWYHSVALKSDGTVWAWGYNYYGQLGNDTNTHSTTANPTPAQVSGLPVIVAISAGQYHSLALDANGNVWAWGWNRYGQLGDSTNTQSDTANSTPMQVSGLANVTAIAAGGSHSLALDTNGAVWGFGYNFYGQLGNTTNNSSANPNPTPTQIANFTGLTAIAAGDFHSLALENDGTVWAWGFNLYGQLGDGAHGATPAPTPVQVTGAGGVSGIAGGAGDSFAIPSSTVAVTILSAITGSTFSVTGTGCQAGNYASPQTLQWLPNSACSVSFTSPQSGTTGTQYVFSSWADGSLNNPRTITTPASATTYTAQFQTQYLLTVAANPANGGSASGAGYYNANTSAPVVATANSGFNFSSWTGPVSSPNSASTTVSMTGPLTATANFILAPTTVTIASSISGLSFSVTGTGCQAGSYSTPQALSWASGASCNVSFSSPQAGPAGTQYVFTVWEDGPTTNSRTILTPASATTYTADFQTQYQLTVAANPANAGSVTGGGYYNAGASAPVGATANTGFAFANWTGAVASAGSASTTVLMSGPLTVTANFNVLATISTVPAGLSFSVTGTGCHAGSYSTPQTLSWTPGSSCNVTFTSPQAGVAGTQYVFSAWDDGPTTNPRTIAAPASATTYTADFQTQYQLTVAANPAGAGVVTGGGYYNAASMVPVTATANNGYSFATWSGTVASATSASTTVTMTGPLTVSANFSMMTTIASVPSGLAFTVSGTGCPAGNYTTPQVLNGLTGSSCSVSFNSPQAGGVGTQYVFSGWSDGPSANPRMFNISSSAATYTANFQRQYLLTTSVGIGGSQAGAVSSGGYFNDGATVSVSAVANPGYQFTGFSGDLSGLTTPQNIIMNGPHSVTAGFGLLTAINVVAAAGEYSDPVTLSATLLPASLAVTGSIQFTVGGVPVGSVPVNGSGSYSLQYVIAQSQGPYPVTAVFTSTTAGILGANGSNSLTVSLEDAVVTPAPSNPAAVLVSSDGGTASVTLTAMIQESPDATPGDITKASPVTFTLNPAVAAAPLSCTASSGTLNTATTPPTLTVACTFTNVPVNVYDVAIAIGGNYYQGAAKSAVAVYDPSLGFVTGNVGVLHNNVAGSSQIDVKYKSGGSLQGSFSYSEQRSGGAVTISATSLQSVSLVGNTAVLVASATVNGAGNYMVRVFCISNGGSGKNDQFGLQVTDANGNVVPDLTFAPLALTSGNIQIH